MSAMERAVTLAPLSQRMKEIIEDVRLPETTEMFEFLTQSDLHARRMVVWSAARSVITRPPNPDNRPTAERSVGRRIAQPGFLDRQGPLGGWVDAVNFWGSHLHNNDAAVVYELSELAQDPFGKELAREIRAEVARYEPGYFHKSEPARETDANPYYDRSILQPPSL